MSEVSRLFVALAMTGLFLASAAAGQSVGAPAGRPQLRVGVLGDGIDLDGIVDEVRWLTADSISSLTMTEPEEGGQATGRTVVRVLASGDDLVFGIIAYDPEPTGIVSFSKQRDLNLRAEEQVILVLDTYMDGRSGYTFGVNPAGARYDALIAGAGEHQSADWDGLWEARTASGSWGWSAEIRIPIRTLGFAPGLDRWGFNIEWQVQRLRETSRWASPRRDYQVTQMSRAGTLEGLPHFDLGMGLSVRPTLVAGLAVPAPGADVDGKLQPSLDLTQRLGANLLASVTVNTDFAETEVDTRQTNLTRFPLFFPEKRSFFLEGSDIFSFGFGLGREVLPFHSRRLGLVSGTPVSLQAGGKVAGRIGNTNVGVLAIRTGEEDGLVPASTMGVIRVQQNILEESSVGFLSTMGDPMGRSGAWLTGADLTLRTSHFMGDNNLIASAWGMANGRADLSGDRTALGFAVDYPNDLWDVFASYKRIGDDFDPSLGFVPRKGIQDFRANVTWLPRPSWPWLRFMRNELFLTLVTDLDGSWESYRIFTAPVNMSFESGDRFEFNIIPEGERLDEPFEISDGVVIPGGSYNWTRWKAEASLASKRPVSGMVVWYWGSFYDGSLDQYQARLDLRPSASLTLELNTTRNVASLPAGNFVQQLVGARVRVNVSPDLQVAGFVQYDNESREIGSNTRLRWTFDPMGDLFIVYNHNLRDIADRWSRESNEVVIKVQYAIRR